MRNKIGKIDFKKNLKPISIRLERTLEKYHFPALLFEINIKYKQTEFCFKLPKSKNISVVRSLKEKISLAVTGKTDIITIRTRRAQNNQFSIFIPNNTLGLV